MYRILSKRMIFVAFGWLVVGLIALMNTVNQITAYEFKATAVPGVAWIALSLVIWNPIWRFVWRKVPRLNRWFPDLNGNWDVALESNWPRHQQLLEAAESPVRHFDIRHCPDDELAPLSKVQLKAVITQTWWVFEMRMFNPTGTSPIERSDTISVDPIGRMGQQQAGICYFYKQVNATDTVSDDTEFYGAARLFYDPDRDRLEGLFWTARMWRRAINTAGRVTMTRSQS